MKNIILAITLLFTTVSLFGQFEPKRPVTSNTGTGRVNDYGQGSSNLDGKYIKNFTLDPIKFRPGTANGQTFVYNSSTGQWELANGSSGNATSIQGISVSATTPTNGQVLQSNGSTLIYAKVDSGEVSKISPNNIAQNGASAGQALVWDNVKEAYAPRTVSSGGGGTPGGSINQVQINNGSTFAGSSKLVYNTSVDTGYVKGAFRMQDTLKAYRILFPYDRRGLRPGGFATISAFNSTVAGTGLIDRLFNIGFNTMNGNVIDSRYPQNGQQFEVDYVTPELDTLNEWHHTFAGRNGNKSLRAMFMKYNIATGRTTHETYADDWQIRWSALGGGGNSKTIFDFNAYGQNVSFFPRNSSGSLNSFIFSPTALLLDSANIQFNGRNTAGVTGMTIVGSNKTAFNIGVRGSTGGSNGRLEIKNDASHYIYIDSTGLIGLNTTPTQVLEIVAPTEQPEAKIYLTSNGSGSSGFNLYTANGFAFDIKATPSRDLWIYAGRYNNFCGFINGLTGNWGFNNGVTATAKVHIGAGTATAGTAPLKFTSTSAALLTTPEANTVEVNSSGKLFYTPSATRLEVFYGLSGSATLDFPSTASLGQSDLTITVTGAADGDIVTLGVVNALRSVTGVRYMAWVSAADTVTVRFNNDTVSSVDPASATFKVSVQK